jgi:hypothetical protein
MSLPKTSPVAATAAITVEALKKGEKMSSLIPSYNLSNDGSRMQKDLERTVA